jgi:gamma-glutamylputrescine oxidase
MNLLHENDRAGRYPASWYAATADPLPPFAPLDGDATADVCIVGGGYTGLSAALHLAEAGRRVILLEAHRVGFGASGRNGGQLGSGQRQDQETLEKMVGRDEAARLWHMGEDAKALVHDLVARHGIDCDLKPGVAWAGTTRGEADDLEHYAAFLWDRYGYDRIDAMDAARFHALCPSPAYKGGLLDMGAGHLHPLRLALGLARAAAAAGATLCEKSEVLDIEDGAQVAVRTAKGTVRAGHLILACNGYLGTLHPQVAARVMPINNFIAATEPLGAEASRVLTRDVAVSDSLFVVNYFRLSGDGRLLFGGGESYGYRFPSDIAGLVRKPMTRIFPHLRDVRIDYAWGGTLGITMKRLPHLARLGRNVLSASGYSGHGVGNAVQAGRLMADAIAGETDGFDTMSRLPTPRFPGGAALRAPLLALAMTWYALRDRIGA